MKRPFGATVRSSALAIAASWLMAAPAFAQEEAARETVPPASGLRAELLSDIDILEGKYMGLAGALEGHFAWRPAEGVRSVSEVFMHIAGASIYLPVFLGVAPPAGMEVGSTDEGFQRMGELERTTDPASVMETLQGSFDHARHVIASVPEADFEEEVTIFGQTFTKRQGLIAMVTHMHEHLGQAVAYARMNGVVPPWSTGG